MWHIALRQLARGAPQIVSEARAYQDANREIAALRSPWPLGRLWVFMLELLQYYRVACDQPRCAPPPGW